MDGDTVVVAAYGDDNYKGSAYLFTKPASGDWATATETAKLTASDRANYDWFGRSVAVDGDTVVVGVTFADGNSTSSGETYLFTKPATGWSNATETAKLTASDGATADYFGDSVAIDGDTVVVGAWGDDNFKGSAYVYEISAWTAIPDSAADEDNGTSYTVTGLTNDEEYSFQIRATNALGTGPTSDAVTVTPSS